MSKVNFGSYSIRNVKTFKGMEGSGGFNLTLFKDGIRLGKVINDDSGGPNMYHIDRQALNDLKAYAKSQYGEEGFEIEDQFIGAMIDAFLQDKQMKRWCKKETIFRVQGDKEDVFRTLKIPYNHPRSKEFLDKKYAGKVIELYNENGERVI